MMHRDTYSPVSVTPRQSDVKEYTANPAKLDYCRNNSISESELHSVLAEIGYGDKHGIASVPFNPGNLHSELQRNQPRWLWVMTQLLAYPTQMGAYTELWAGWSKEVG